MQIKIILIALLIGCSYLIGNYIYIGYTKRHKQLNDLIRILEIMRMDLSFGLYTLGEIFSKIGSIKEYSYSNFFAKVAEDLSGEKGLTLEEIVQGNSEILTKENYLQNKEVDELKKLIVILGKSDVDSQTRMIDLCIENLKRLTVESKDEISKKGVVYKKLAVVVGIAIGIILI